MKRTGLIVTLLASVLANSGASAESRNEIKTAIGGEPTIELEYRGVAVKTKDTHVWGTSPIIGPDGKVHLYVAQWQRPVDNKFSGNTKDGERSTWYISSQIAHYVGDSPEGPFTFLRMAVPDQDGNFNAPHNPTIKYIDGKYVLLFIVNNGGAGGQRIIMYTADDLSDNWQPAKEAEPDGTILRKSTDSGVWDHVAMLGNSNPTLVKHNGTYMLYFKGVIPVPRANKRADGKIKRTWAYGVALSNQLEGPYTKQPNRLIDSYDPMEDAYAFSYKDRVWMFFRDMAGKKGGGGMVLNSKDGIKFDYDDATVGFHHLAHYIGNEELAKRFVYRGPKHGHLERPQVLFVDGKPAYLYAASGMGFPEAYGCCSYVFKMTFETQGTDDF